MSETSTRMKPLDLVIIGAQKAGTTSLNNYIRMHPKIAGHAATEFAFFSSDAEYSEGYEQAIHRYFAPGKGEKLVAKNTAIAMLEKAIDRLHRHNPEVKLVYVIRDPVDRAYSAYTMAVKDGWMKRPFNDLLRVLEQNDFNDIMYRHFVAHGSYARQLQQVLHHFPVQNLRVYLFDDLTKNPQKVCDSIFDWMGLEPVPVHSRAHNKTFQPRSHRTATMIARLRRHDNPLRRLAKSTLPAELFSAWGRRLRRLNESRERFPPIPQEMVQPLRSHFQPGMEDLRNLRDKHGPRFFNQFSEPAWMAPADPDEA